MDPNPVFFDLLTNKWWFWDETWTNKIGPFNSKEDAENADIAAFDAKRDNELKDLLPWEKDCVIELEEFIESCKDGDFIDDDGYGHPLLNGKVNDKIEVNPSDLSNIPAGTTHIVWYNK